MPETVNFFNPQFPVETRVHSVALKRDWADPWTEIEYLHADRITWEVAPGVPTAQLYWRFGEGYRPGEQFFRFVAPLFDRGRNYVRITTNAIDGGDAWWYGTFEVEGRELDGTIDGIDNVTGQRAFYPTGKQALVCYGLENLLDTTIVYTSEYVTPSGDRQTCRRGLTFNEGGLPNRTKARFGNSYLFKAGSDVSAMEPATAAATHLAEMDYWSTRDIVEYLLLYHGPHDAREQRRLPLYLRNSDLLPDWDRPVLETQGKRLSELLAQLIPRARLLGWYLDVMAVLFGDPNDGNQAIELEVFTFATDPIRLEEPGPARIPANDHQRHLVFDFHSGGGSPVVKRSTLDAVDEVRATGARRRVCFSAWDYDGTAKAGWSYTNETRYNSGASTAAGYPADGDEKAERQRMNRRARSVDSLSDVYAKFAFDFLSFKTHSAEEGDLYPIAPDDDDPTVALPIFMPAVVTLRTIPFAEPGGLGKELPPLVFCPLEGGGYTQIERVGADGDIEQKLDELNRKWSAHVTVPGDQFCLNVNVDGGPGQHVIALADFSAVDSSDTLDNVPAMDWHDFIFTLAIEEDRHCEVRWPNPMADRETVRQLHIPCGENYRLDYVVPRTVIGVDYEEGELQRHDGGFVRDDRPVLKRVARLAYEWYRDARTSIEFETTQFKGPSTLWLGDLVTSIGDARVEGLQQQTINAVVTSIELTFPRVPAGSPPPTARVRYQTQYGQLDPLRIVI